MHLNFKFRTPAVLTAKGSFIPHHFPAFGVVFVGNAFKMKTFMLIRPSNNNVLTVSLILMHILSLKSNQALSDVIKIIDGKGAHVLVNNLSFL